MSDKTPNIQPVPQKRGKGKTFQQFLREPFPIKSSPQIEAGQRSGKNQLLREAIDRVLQEDPKARVLVVHPDGSQAIRVGCKVIDNPKGEQ